MPFQPGDVIRVRFPLADASGTLVRPAVVLADDGVDVIALRVTSHPPRLGTADVALRDWSLAGLLRPSTVRLKPAALSPSLVLGSIGHLSPTDWAQVLRALLTEWIGRPAAAAFLATQSLAGLPAALIEALARVSLQAAVTTPGVDLAALRGLLPP